MQRRQLFAMKVEEEERQRKQVEEMWTKHQEQCVALGVDPNQTTLFNNNYPPYYPPLPPPHMQGISAFLCGNTYIYFANLIIMILTI